MAWFSFAKKDAPAPKPAEERAPEDMMEETSKPELKVAEPISETKDEGTSASLRWAEAKKPNVERAQRLFDSVNTFFRKQAESRETKKWDKDSVHYKVWKESTVQVEATEWLVKETTLLEQAKKELAELGEKPDLLMPRSGATLEERKKSLEESLAYDKKMELILERIDIQTRRVEDLETAYNERELEIAKLEAEMEGRFDGEEQNIWNKATATYQELVAAEDALAALKRGLLKRLFGSFGKSKKEKETEAQEIDNAKKRVDDAKAAVAAIDSALDDMGLTRGNTGAKDQLASFRTRQSAHNRTMSNTGKGSMTR